VAKAEERVCLHTTLGHQLYMISRNRRDN